MSGELVAEELFRPAMRPCICLPSDWRNYQLLSANLDAAELEAILSRYYEYVQVILHDIVSEGNYFSDWIADELFVVIFCKDESQLSEIGRLALRFSQRLLECKNGLFSFGGHAPGIDIGLASGHAYVGMLGPDGHKKATALGEIPGRARRLQSVGRTLRGRLGENDRIIFGADIANLCAEKTTFRTLLLEARERPRDIGDDFLYFLDANLSPEEKDSMAA